MQGTRPLPANHTVSFANSCTKGTTMTDLKAPRYDGWYAYDELTSWLHDAARLFPDRCSISAIGSTPEDRQIWMLQVTDQATGAAEDKPIFLVHGNIHAKELAGTTSCLQLIHTLLTGQIDGVDTAALLEDVAFCIIPRLNPDGAEFAVTTGGEIRSRREEFRLPNNLYQHDVDGDGHILSMRVETPDGDMKADDVDPRLMVPRKPTDNEGPFYRVHPEGLIHDYDGGDFSYHARGHDFNRNWPANWHQEHEQHGAGDYPFSEPEMKALAEFVYSHPSIFAALGFHCGTNAILSPPSSGSETDLDPADREVFRQLSERAAELTGFGPLATIDYRNPKEPSLSLKGHSGDWGYKHMGLYHYEIELGNIYNAAGVTAEEFFNTETRERSLLDRDALRYHDEHPEYEIFVDWRDIDHPQLGKVQVGGWKKFWLINPSLDDLRTRIAPGSAQFIVEYAARRPILDIADLEVASFGDIHRIRARVRNTGAFPTNITQRALTLRSLKPVQIELVLGDDAEMVSRHRHLTIGHLAPHARSPECEWFVKATAPANLLIRATCQRGIDAEASIDLG